VTKLMPPSTASTCGLLCEIGAMACLAVDGKVYSKIWLETANDFALRVAKETERYAVTSFEIGRRFLERNSLPDEVSSVVGAELGADSSTLTVPQKVCLAARHSAAILVAFGATDESATIGSLEGLMSQLDFAQLDGKGLYELLLREGLMRDLGRR